MNLLLFILFAICLLQVTGFFIRRAAHPVKAEPRQQEVENIERLLPQTQCGDCGFSGCRPYAEAIVTGTTDINRCLPGGINTVRELAALTGREVKPLYRDSVKSEIKKLAVIDESVCIGCVKCISACPVDAILGAPKVMHSVINKYCIGPATD